MKKLVNLDGAKILTRFQLRAINGGNCSTECPCPAGKECFSGSCNGCPTDMCRYPPDPPIE